MPAARPVVIHENDLAARLDRVEQVAHDPLPGVGRHLVEQKKQHTASKVAPTGSVRSATWADEAGHGASLRRVLAIWIDATSSTVNCPSPPAAAPAAAKIPIHRRRLQHPLTGTELAHRSVHQATRVSPQNRRHHHRLIQPGNGTVIEVSPGVGVAKVIGDGRVAAEVVLGMGGVSKAAASRTTRPNRRQPASDLNLAESYGETAGSCSRQHG
jgi:hypothetical protein